MENCANTVREVCLGWWVLIKNSEFAQHGILAVLGP